MSSALRAAAALRRLPPPPLPSALPSLPLQLPLRASSTAAASTATYNDSSYSHATPSTQTTPLLSRAAFSPLTEAESHRSVLDLYRKICRLLPQVLKGYELEGEDSYHRALRNLRFHFEHHRQLQDRHVVEVLRHKAEMEIEEALLMYKTKSHVAALIFQEPQLASVARASRDTRLRGSGGGEAQQGKATPSPFLQDFLAGTA